MSKLEDNFVCYLGLDLVCPIKASRIWCVQFEKAWIWCVRSKHVFTHVYTCVWN